MLNGFCDDEYGCDYTYAVVMESLQAYREPGDTTQTLFHLDPGDTAHFVTQMLRVDRFRILLVNQPYESPNYSLDPKFRTGDTVTVLFHSGEGIYHLFYKRDFYDMEGFWDNDSIASTIQKPHSDMWIQISSGKNQRGWIRWPYECDAHERPDLQFGTKHPHED